jgi:CRISPR-associated endonuclease Cas1
MDQDEPYSPDGYQDVDDPTGPVLTLADLRDQTALAEAAFGPTSIATSDVLVVDGTNITLRVRRGCLEIVDGVSPVGRRTRTIPRSEAGHAVRRVLVLGPGMISTEAMVWCQQQRLPLIVARTRTEPTMIGAAALYDHPGLRRRQALSAGTEGGMAVVRWLIDRRLQDQARVCERLGRPDQADSIQALRRALGPCRTVDDALIVEGKGADRFWQCWDRVEVRFATQDRARVPAHWYRFGGRRSPLLAGRWSNRYAADPVNALLNYGFKLAEVEATVACLSVGLDTGLGLLHADRQGRRSMSLDLMESVRGVVEETVLELLRARTFRKSNFAESPSGQVTLRPPLTHELVGALLPILRDALGPTTEQAARMIADGDLTVPTSLTGQRRGRRPRVRKPARFSFRCGGCGELLPPGQEHRAFCDDCLPAARQERGMSPVGTTKPKRVRPRRVYETASGAKRADTMRAKVAAQQAWEEAHRGERRPAPSEFEPIRAALAGVPLRRIAEAADCSDSGASAIRRGKLVPHLRFWEALANIRA